MKNKSESLFVVIPAYNEEANINAVLSEWYSITNDIANSQLLIIDDGSNDQTYNVVKDFQKTHPKVQILHTENRGHGKAILTGYQYALQENASYIFQTDSDGQTNPGIFPLMWEHRHQYALSIGYRKHRKDGISRKCVTNVLRILLFLIFGQWILDANCPYRLMEGKSLKNIISQLPANCELTNIYITAAYMQTPENIHHYEIPFEKRKGGTNSIHMMQIIRMGLRNLHTFWTFRNHIKTRKRESI